MFIFERTAGMGGMAEVVDEFIACCEVGEEGCLVDVMFVDGLVPHVLTRTNVWEG